MPADRPTSYLSGKITKYILPVFNGPPPPDAPALRRLLLPQGELAQFHGGEQPVHYMAFVELREGTLRGNHCHTHKEEFIYVLDGEFDLIAENSESKARETIAVRAGELVMIRPGIAHVLRVTRSGHAVEYSKERFDPADTYRYPLVSG
jgi:quercetin dioxygenase-like cupin family protein